MANIKELQTRIALKYDSYTAWTTSPGKDLKLLKGEMGICEIQSSNTDSNVAPTVLFKVGDGTKTFEQLPWASAKAADVYGWAKASDVVLEGKTIKFVGTNKTIELNYITADEVKAITDPIAQSVSDNTAEISAVKGRVDTLTGDGEGSVTKAVADAVTEVKAYADTAEADAVTTAKTYTDARETEIKKYADDKMSTLTATGGAVAQNTAAISAHTSNKNNPHEVTKAQVGLGNVDNKSVATIKSEFTGAVTADSDGFVTGSAVHTAITGAQSVVEQKVTDLANGAVKDNTAKIAEIEEDYKEADTGLANRITDVEETLEVFFKDATLGGEGAQNALDTLKEIQEFINTEGTTAAKMVEDIDKNAEAIEEQGAALEALKSIVNLEGGQEGGLKKTLTDMQSEIDANEGSITTLQNLTSGYTGTGAIKTAIEAAQTKANNAYDLADAVSTNLATTTSDLATLAGVVNHATTGLAATKDIADQAAADIAALTNDTGRVAVVEGKVSALEGIVSTGADANSKLRQAITDLQALTGTNGKLQSDIATAKSAADTAQDTANAAADQANTNKADIADIKEKYLKIADFETDYYIFNCGSSTQVTHEK